MKIIHISDLHFGMHYESIADGFLKDLVDIKPDVILISGDLTHRATNEQYKNFINFYNQLQAVVCLVPGNHDIPLYNLFARMFYPFRQYKRHVSPNLWVSFQNKFVRILGVNSVNPNRVKDGTLSLTTLDHINQYFKSSFDGLSILFFHHNFDYVEGLHKPLENYKQFLSYLKDSPIDMVCTGHFHYANLSFFEKSNHKVSVLLHAGSLLCRRSKDGLNSYYLIETTQDSCKIHWRVFQTNLFETVTSHSIDFKK